LIERDGLSLRAAPLWGFQIPQGDNMEEGILLDDQVDEYPSKEGVQAII